MEGDLSDPDMYGVIPRSAEFLFNVVSRPEYISHSVIVSYLEIYNEELCDLLAEDDNSNGRLTPTKQALLSNTLQIMEGKDGVVCRGLTEKKVESAADILEIMNAAQKHRKISETNMNKHSSRSHCVFTLRLNSRKQLKNGNVFESRGKLHLVDLAGSECAKTAGFEKEISETRDDVSRERGRERSNINRSLLTLGRVIIMLNEQSAGKKLPKVRIPYRDSKLTRILQDSLGGKCKTVVIATVSPSILSIEETMSTLNYAHSASGIMNKPIAVSHISVGTASIVSPAMIDMSDAKSEERLEDMYTRMEYMKVQLDEAQAALARQCREQKSIIERAEKAETELMESEHQLEISEINLKKSNAILEATKETEKRLTFEANELMKRLETSIVDGNKLHDLLVESKEVDMKRRSATKGFHFAVLNEVSTIMSKLDKLKDDGNCFHSNIATIVKETNVRDHQELDESVQLLDEIKLQVSDVTTTMKHHVQDENGILDIMTKLTNNVQENLRQVKKTIECGEKDLITSINSTSMDIKAYSETLLKMETEYDDSSGVFAKEIDSLVYQANVKVTAMVSSAVDALLQAREESSKTRVSLSEMLATFQSLSTSSVAGIQEKSYEYRKLLSESMESFADGMQHIDGIQGELDKQYSLMSTKGVNHLKDIDLQRKLISSQGNDIRHAKEEQKRLEQIFLHEILKGVTSLVNGEMNRLSIKHEEELTMVEEQNHTLNDLTEEVIASVNTLCNDIKETSDAIDDYSSRSKQMDMGTKSNAYQTNNVLAEIESTSGKQIRVESAILVENEIPIAAASNTLRTDNIDHDTTFITDTLNNDLKGDPELNNLQSATTPRTYTMSDFSNTINTKSSAMVEGVRSIEQAASNQVNNIDARDDIGTSQKDFRKKDRRSAIDAIEKSLVQNIDGYSDISATNLSTMQAFASKTVVQPVIERKQIKYSRYLSSTPKHYDIDYE